MYDQNQEYREGKTDGEWINVTFGGEHSGTGTVFGLPPTNLSGGTDDAFPINSPVLIAGSQKKAALLGKYGTLPPAISDILNQTDALIVVVRVVESSDDADMSENVIAGINSLLTSAQINEVTPRIIIAPDYSARDEIAAQLKWLQINSGECVISTLRALLPLQTL